MDILLINPGHSHDESVGNLKEFWLPMPSIGLAYLAASLENNDHSVVCYDDFLYKANNAKLVSLLTQMQPIMVGISTFTSGTMSRVSKIIKIIKSTCPNSKIVLGNIHASIFPEHTLRTECVDFVVIGEGEVTICDLLFAVKNHENSFSQIAGIAFLDSNGKYVKTKNREPIMDLDQIPFPAWHLFPIEKYDIFAFGKSAGLAMLISGSRGCPYRCTFCSLVVHGGKRRKRSVSNIVDEIEFFHKKYGINQFGFVDPSFPATSQEGINFSQEIILRKLDKKISWVSETRIDSLNLSALLLMAQAGCRRLMFGVETSSQKTINQLNKQFQLDQTYKLIENCKKAKIESLGFFILGIPGETEEDLRKTIKFSISCGMDYAKFAVFTPYPGTAIFEELKEKQQLDINNLFKWNSYIQYPSEATPPIYKNKHISMKRLAQIQQKAYFNFYCRPSQIRNLLKYFSPRDYIRMTKYIIDVFLKKFFI